MPYKAKLNDYVSYKDGDELKYGIVTAVGETDFTVTTQGKTKKGALEDFKDIESSAWAKMKIRAVPNIVEVLENMVFATGYHLFRGHRFMGSENMSFLIADLIHEYLTKQLSEGMMDIFIPSIVDEDADAFFLATDATDALKKGPVVALVQQCVQRFIYGKSWSHNIMSNLLGNTGVMYLSNIADRMIYQDEKKVPKYRYK